MISYNSNPCIIIDNSVILRVTNYNNYYTNNNLSLGSEAFYQEQIVSGGTRIEDSNVSH